MKKVKLEVKCMVELELDERCDDAALEWACHDAFEQWSDGRLPFSVEQAYDGIGRAAVTFMHIAHGAAASKIASKYPGATLRPYEISQRMPDPKIERVHRIKARVVPPVTCMCGRVDPETEIAEDGLERCIHCGCH